MIRKLEYITEEETVTDSGLPQSIDFDNSQMSEREKWLEYGARQVKQGHIQSIKNERLYVIDHHSEPRKGEDSRR